MEAPVDGLEQILVVDTQIIVGDHVASQCVRIVQIGSAVRIVDALGMAFKRWDLKFLFDLLENGVQRPNVAGANEIHWAHVTFGQRLSDADQRVDREKNKQFEHGWSR